MFSFGPFCEEIGRGIVFRINSPGPICTSQTVTINQINQTFKIAVIFTEKFVMSVSMGFVPGLDFPPRVLEGNRSAVIERSIDEDELECKLLFNNANEDYFEVPTSVSKLMVHIVQRHINHIQYAATQLEVELNLTELELDGGGYALRKNCVDNRKFPKMHTDLLRLLQVIVHSDQVFLRLVEKCSSKDWFAREDLTDLEILLGHLNGLKKNVDLMFSRVTAILAGLDSWLAKQINTKLYTISLISIIFLPLSLITGVFGMNVGGIPWTGQHSPKDGFLKVMLVSVVFLFIVILLPALCRYLKRCLMKGQRDRGGHLLPL